MIKMFKKQFLIISLAFISIVLLANFSTVNLTAISQSVNQNINKNLNSADVKYDLLIVTAPEFSKYLTPLAKHKNDIGIDTKIVTTEDIYIKEFWKGSDNAEKIKYFIKDCIENWNISYVLLVGGRKDQGKTETWWVPPRYSHLIRDYKGHENWPEGDFLTDLYFADIYDEYGNFSSWDDDNDGIFGEWQKNCSAEDKPHLIPDIAVGRLPCRNIIDVKIVVDKIIRYETMDFDDSWFKKMVVVAGDTYPIKTDYIDGENYTQQALDIMTDFQAVKIWSTLGNLHWFPIVRAINKGCGFVFFSGHGGGNTWATHPPNNSKKWIGDFELKHMFLLFNRYKLPVCLSASGCFNNMFNVSLRSSFLVTPTFFNFIPLPFGAPRCWGWNLVRNPNGGSIATIASTAYSYESSDVDSKRGGCEWLDIHFFKEYKKSDTKILGDCWKNTVTGFVQNFTINWNDTALYDNAIIAKNVQQWLLIGDPSLNIGGYKK